MCHHSHVAFIRFVFVGLVKYDVLVQGAAGANLKVTLTDRDGHCVASSSESSGSLRVVDVKLWWPYLMHSNPAYLYSMEVRQHNHFHVVPDLI